MENGEKSTEKGSYYSSTSYPFPYPRFVSTSYFLDVRSHINVSFNDTLHPLPKPFFPSRVQRFSLHNLIPQAQTRNVRRRG